MTNVRFHANTVGIVVKYARVKEGLTLRELSDKCNLSVSYLSDIERGRTVPSLGALTEIMDALDADLRMTITK